MSELNNKERIFISPLARVIASQNNVDISKIKGSGPYGRIVKKDILDFVSDGGAKSGASVGSTSRGVGTLEYVDTPNSGMRKTIGKRLLESKTTVPHYYLTVECNMDTLLKAREDINKAAKDKYKVSVNDFIVKAVGLALRDNKDANSSWLGEVTRTFNRSDVAVAVAIDNGLITPIVKDAANKGLVEISNEVKDLVVRAKAQKLKPEEYQGGTFAISNLGMYGIKEFMAIINPPHSGILAVGATEKRVIVVKDQMVIANMMNITISADHRVLDGAKAAVFLNSIKGYLENPVNMIL